MRGALRFAHDLLSHLVLEVAGSTLRVRTFSIFIIFNWVRPGAQRGTLRLNWGIQPGSRNIPRSCVHVDSPSIEQDIEVGGDKYGC